LTGELTEYRRGHTRTRTASKGWEHTDEESDRDWSRRVRDYCRRWAFEHRDGREDTWTPAVSAEEAADGR
jgi:hypothetical protein